MKSQITKQNKELSLGIDNLLLRGSKLKNTEYIYGVTIFQGHDTKIMRNNTKAKYKFSKLEYLLNKSILVILALQITFAIIGGSIGTAWTTDPDNSLDYLLPNYQSNADEDKIPYIEYLIGNLGAWVLIFTNFVPISLMITFELVKFW